jgi:predicted DNA-binding ArsR family transcriptional regulator
MKPPSLAIVKSSLKVDIVPEGWYTRRDLEEAWGLSTTRTSNLINKAVQSGMAEHRTFRIQAGLRGLYPTQHYRFKEAKG